MKNLIIIISVAAVIVLLAALYYVYSKKRKRKEFFTEMRNRQLDVTIPTNIELAGMDLKYLVGKKGTAATDIKPLGKMRIDNEIFEVKAIRSIIRSQEKIVIIKIGTDNSIFVDSDE